MASTLILNPTKNHRWLNGFGNIVSKENHQWWGTWTWLIQVLIWAIIINGMLAYMVLIAPKNPIMQQPAQELSEVQLAEASKALLDGSFTIFFSLSFLSSVGVVLLSQDALIDEKRSGTAAWVLSKPVSRTAFLMAKFVADTIGIMVTIVIIQGVIGFFILKAGTGINLPIPNCLAALGLVALSQFFFLSLTYMLGTMSNSRGLIIGLPLILSIGGSSLGGLFPLLTKIMPWNFFMDMKDSPTMAIALVNGDPLTTVVPIIGTAAISVLFIVLSIWRIYREEF